MKRLLNPVPPTSAAAGAAAGPTSPGGGRLRSMAPATKRALHSRSNSIEAEKPDNSTKTKKPWKLESWRACPVKQQPVYPDEQEVEKVLETVRTLPPLVSAKEVEDLRKQLAEVADGRRFLLQGGDCAERFLDCKPDQIEKKLRIVLQMSLVLTYAARMPCVRVGRMAGQYSKPRSNDTEVVEGVEVPVFRGDNVNGFDLSQRTPDPNRLLTGYFHAAAALNFARTILKDGFGDIHRSDTWELGFVQSSRHKNQYQDMLKQIHDCLHFVHTCGVGYDNNLATVDLFTSHEALLLSYEEALTREVDGKWYNLSAPFIWIGDRTRQLDHAHVEYFRGIANPVGVKVGPSMKPDELVELLSILWPEPEATPGKVTLITRYGADKVEKFLPEHIKAVRQAGYKVVWCCDPCHGNTFTTPNGYKSRHFDQVLKELRLTFEAHEKLGSRLGGVHFEMTGENVTECTGGPENLTAADLPQCYQTYCDPRLNYSQSMEVAFLLANLLHEDRDLME